MQVFCIAIFTKQNCASYFLYDRYGMSEKKEDKPAAKVQIKCAQYRPL